MVEPASLFTLALNALVKSAPQWLHALEGLALSRGKEFTISQGQKYLDDRRHLKHMGSALEKAAMKGRVKFTTLAERDQYRAIIEFLAQPGPNNEKLLQEAMGFLTLSGTPDFSMLAERYNLRERIHSLARHAEHEDVDVTPYLNSFFEQFREELFADDLFKQQVSNVLMVRSSLSMQQSLTEIAAMLPVIKDAVTDNYTQEQFVQDVQAYIAHVERSLRYLKVVGIVPKDQNKDPELEGIFVPLRIALHRRVIAGKINESDSIVTMLERYPHLVLLGGPGSGKSTATKYLAWSHASARIADTPFPQFPLISGKPVPLRIELRRLSEDRRSHPDYTFLSYAEVLLRREGIEINPQMFKRLLANKNMLLLFDGLDEVATLDERKQLVDEIEGFVSSHPGNHVIVASRPVGYDLARLSNQLFDHAMVQDFNDVQIREFLERWYTYMLRLSPIPHEDQQELEELFKALKENSRLHKLAENPLLLTVITPLHRYERLPDKRVQVYDRCADILLETWAKLRGTKARWRDIQMAKEDQYACIAYLGSVLHTRSQEANDSGIKAMQLTALKRSVEDTATDVTSKFILKEIKHFLKDRNLLREANAQSIEAARFLELMQVEAGLIVERGTNEYNENLYGFVHRTFQEYFAAVDVYERYQQEEDRHIISDFLIEYLHDPHWHEVILLLLGKLKRKPVTTLLRQILEGSIKSYRSKYVDILQQDLFFVCDCLTEEVIVENELMETVISNLSRVMKTSLFQSQRSEAAKYLGKLMQTRQYANYAREAFAAVIADATLKIDRKIDIAQAIINDDSFTESKGEQQISHALLNWAQDAELSIEQRIDAARTLIYREVEPEIRREAAQLLLHLAQDAELSIEQRIDAARPLIYRNVEPEIRREAEQVLLDIMQNCSLEADQRLQAAARYINASGEGTMNIIDSIRVQAILLAFNLLNNGALSHYFEKHWPSHGGVYYGEIHITDLPHLITLVQQDLFPVNVRNSIYQVLTEMIAQFDKI